MRSTLRTTPRQKAVWGPKRTLAAAAILVLGFAPGANAAAREHAREGRKAVAGRPNSHVKDYRVDSELTFRAARGNGGSRTKVIVELKPGATLPVRFQQ